MNQYARDIHRRLRECTPDIGPQMTRRAWELLEEHEEENEICRTCNAAAYPCPPVAVLGRLLRVEEEQAARYGVEMLVADVRSIIGHGRILTVLRRPDLDSLDRSCTHPADHPDEELFGYEVVVPEDTVAVRLPGLPIGVLRNTEPGRTRYTRNHAGSYLSVGGGRYKWHEGVEALRRQIIGYRGAA